MIVIKEMPLIQNVTQFLNKNRPIKAARSAISLYMVRASVFLENKVYTKAIELFNQLTAQYKHLVSKFEYWLINPQKLKSIGGVVAFSYDSQDTRKHLAL